MSAFVTIEVDPRPCGRGCGRRGEVPYTGFDRDRPEEWTCHQCYRAEEFRPGHELNGDRRHFMGTGCNDCCARTVMGMTLEQVEYWYRYGNVSQDVWEAYTHAWVTSAPRFGSYGSWRRSPVIPEVVRLVAVMRGIATLKVSVKR